MSVVSKKAFVSENIIIGEGSAINPFVHLINTISSEISDESMTIGDLSELTEMHVFNHIILSILAETNL